MPKSLDDYMKDIYGSEVLDTRSLQAVNASLGFNKDFTTSYITPKPLSDYVSKLETDRLNLEKQAKDTFNYNAFVDVNKNIIPPSNNIQAIAATGAGAVINLFRTLFTPQVYTQEEENKATQDLINSNPQDTWWGKLLSNSPLVKQAGARIGKEKNSIEQSVASIGIELNKKSEDFQYKSGRTLQKKEQDLTAYADLGNKSLPVKVLAGAVSSIPTNLITQIPGVGWFLMGNQIARNSIEEIKQKEILNGKAFNVGIGETKVIGDVAIQIGSEMLFGQFAKFGITKGSISNATKGIVDYLFKTSAKTLAKEATKLTLKETGKFIVKSGVEEGAEELIAGLATGVLSKFTTDSNLDWFSAKNDGTAVISLMGIIEATLAGGLSGGVLSGFSNIGTFKNLKQASENMGNKPMSQITVEEYQQFINSAHLDMQDPINQELVTEVNMKIINDNTTVEQYMADANRSMQENGMSTLPSTSYDNMVSSLPNAPVSSVDAAISMTNPIAENVPVSIKKAVKIRNNINISKAPTGRKITVQVDSNNTIETKIQSVQLSDIINSIDADGNSNANFPKELQARDTDRKSTQVTINKIASNPGYSNLLLTETIQKGTPVISSSGVVIAGNHRVAAFLKMIRDNPSAYQAYKDYVVKNSESLGIDASQLSGDFIIVRTLPKGMANIALAEKNSKEPTKAPKSLNKLTPTTKTKEDVTPTSKTKTTSATKTKEVATPTVAVKAPTEASKLMKYGENVAKLTTKELEAKLAKGEDVTEDVNRWFKTDDAKEITSIKTESEYVAKLSAINTSVTDEKLTHKKLLNVNLQLFALKAWGDRLAIIPKGSSISLYAKNLLEAMRSGSTEEIQFEIETNFKTSDLFHKILANETTIAKAESDVLKKGDVYLTNLEAKLKDDNQEITPSDVVAASMFAKQLIENDNVIRADQLVKLLSKRMTKAGQFIQSAILLSKVFPEYQSQRVIKEVEASNTFDKKRIFDAETKETKDILNKTRQDALEDTVKELVKPSDVPPVNEKESEKLTVAMRLKNRILTYMKNADSPMSEKTRELSEETKLYQYLYRKFLDKQPRSAPRAKGSVVNLVSDIVTNRTLYAETWDEAQRLAKLDPNIKETNLYKFLEILADPVLADSIMKKTVVETISNMGDSVANMAKEYFLNPNATLSDFSSAIASKFNNLDESAIKYLQTYIKEIFIKKMDKYRAKAIQSLKTQVSKRKMWKKQVETQEFVIQKLIDIAYKDGLSIPEIQEQWAKRLGVTVVTEQIKLEIYKTMKEIAQEPNQDRKNELYDVLATNIAETVLATPYEKAVAVIRFSLLMNPSSLIRNMVNNLAVAPQYALADRLQNKIMRLSNVAQEDMISGEKFITIDPNTDIGKITDEMTHRVALDRYLKKTEKYSFKKILGREKPIFKNSVLERFNKMPGLALNEGKLFGMTIAPLGDSFMFSKHFRHAMANKLNALRYSETLKSNVKDDMVATAMSYANEVATRRVFRELNMASTIIGNLKAKDKKQVNKLREQGKFAEARSLELGTSSFSMVVDSVYRFLITPAAIGAEIYRFSPVALAVTVGKDFLGAKITGTWAESNQRALFAKKFSQAFVGTSSQFALGILLSAFGMLDAEAPEDEKERKQWEIDGRRAWSIRLPGNNSISIDWLQPIAGNVMLGASVFNAIRNKSLDKIPSNAIDLFLSFSVLNNVNRAFGYKYATSSQKVTDFLLSSGYQFLPVIMIRLNKVLDPYVRDTYGGSAAQQVAYKILSVIPGATYSIPAKVDVWGRPIRQGKYDGFLGVVERSILNFISPFTVSRSTMDNTTRQINDLYTATKLELGNKVLPSVPSDKIKYPDIKEQYQMSHDEYEQYQIEVGQKSYELIDNYLNVMVPNANKKRDIPTTDLQKVAFITTLYDDAKKIVKDKFILEHPR